MPYEMKDWEKKCAIDAGKKAGEYLDTINKTDLATLTEAEWKKFCEVMCMNYAMHAVVPF